MGGTFTAITGTIQTSTGTGVLIGASGGAVASSGGSVKFTFGGDISSPGGSIVEIQDRTGGTVTFSGTLTEGTINAGQTGILIDGSAGTINFNGQTFVSAGAGTGNGVTLTNNSGTINFAPTGTGLDITTTSGSGLVFTGGGTLNITGAANSVVTGTGQILNLGGTMGTSGIAFQTLSSSGTVAGSAININNLDAAGAGTFSGGAVTIAATSGAASDGIFIGGSSLSTFNFASATINNTGDEGIEINGTGNGAVTFTTVAIGSGTSGNGVEVNGANNNVIISGGSINAGADALNVTGGTGAVTVAANISKSTAGNVVEVTGHNTGTIAISGNIATTGAVANGVNLVNNTGGNITFTGDVSLVTGTNTGFNFTNTGGTGANVSLSNGAMDITTTGGTGINSTNSTVGAGSLTITGASNAVAASTGRAINIDGVTTNATFLSVNVSGGGTTTGVWLQNTGSGGQFLVTGTGSTAGSGGTITSIGGGDAGSITAQPTTGTGIYMNNVANVSLSNMFFGTAATTMSNFGIRGDNVNNFTLRDSEFRGAFGTNFNFDEATIRFGSQNVTTGLTGTALFEGNVIGGGIEDNLSVYVYGANTLNLTIKDSANDQAVFSNVVENTNDGFYLESGGTSNVAVNVTGVAFNGAKGDLMQVLSTGSTTQTILIQSNTFHNAHSAIISGGGGIAITGGGTNINIDYLIDANSFKGMRSSAIFSSYGGISGTISGLITNNTQGTANGVYDTTQALRGSMEGMFFFGGVDAKQLGSTGNVNYALRIEGNTIRDINGAAGIFIRSNQQDSGGQARVEATITNNTIAEVGINVAGGIYLQPGGASLNNDKGTLGANISNNNINLTGGAGDAVVFDQASTIATFYMPGYTSAPSANPNTLANFLINTKGNVFTNAAVSGGGGVLANTSAVQNQAFTLPIPMAMFSVPRPAPREYFASITNFEINATVIAAANTREVSPAFSEVSFLAPIASALTSSASESGARIAPTHTAEVRDQRSDVRTAEIGDQESGASAHHALNSKLETRNARSEEKAEVRAHQATVANLASANANLAALAAPLAGSFNVNIGTLPANDSVTITFQVQIANTLTPASANTVSNQATVTADGPINKVSDDPQTTPPVAGDGNDATVTPIDKFEPSIDIQSSDTTTDQGDSVTFTATVAHGTALVDPLPTGTVNFVDQTDANPLNWETLCSNVALTVGASNSTAQCTTSAVDGGVRTIAAVYSSDGRYDPATDAVTQTVTACPTNPVVTKVADTNDGVCDVDCSLREAIATVCSTAGNNTITFAFGAGQAFENPATITLSASFGALTIDRDMTILAPAHGITVVGSGNASHRVLIVNAARTATINRLTITGGNSDAIGGGGIKNDGTLTLKNSTVSGNATTQNGAGIHNSSVLNVVNSTISGNISTIDGGSLIQDGVSPTLYMVNSTVSGNTANGEGGGLDLRNGTATILNSTVTGNHGDNDDVGGGGAGGIRQQTATVTIRNTIVAGNYLGSGTATANDIDGTVSGNNNLIGDAITAGGLINGVNGNIVGAVIANVLGTVLANNGGPTKTHRLIAGSAALDAGEDASLPTDTFDADGDANTGEALDVDQRGFDRSADTADTNTTDAVDIGAFEAQASVAVFTDATIAQDTNHTVTDFSVGDPDYTLTVTASSDNTTLVPNAPANLAINAGSSASKRTLVVTPAAGQSGTANITVTVTDTASGTSMSDTFLLTVTFVDVPPVVSSIVRANANPTNVASVDFTVTFSEAVTGVDTTDFVLTTTGGISSASVTTVTPITAMQYTVTVNTGSGSGTIRLDVTDDDTVVDGASNPLGGTGAGNGNFTTGEFYTVDKTPPTANITDVTPDPRNNSVTSITIVFTEAVTGFDLADLSLTLNGGGNLLTGAQTLTTGDNITWTLGNLSGITGTGGNYLLTLTAAGSGITDNASNALAGDATDSWVMDTAAPTVTINQAVGQSDPTSSSPINFTVVFSEPVTGFTNTDVTFSGAGATTATITEVAPNDGTTYNVAISGMNADGTVQATVNVNAAQDGVGYNSAASTSTDNTVQFINAITINVQDAKVPEPASPNTIDMTFTVALSSPAAAAISVNFTTNNGSATFGTCGNPGADYVLTSGTVNFAIGDQVKTINVPICSDAVADDGETFTVTLSSPTAPGVIGDGTATGTITANTAGTVLISELRTSGPGGAGDDFVEISNNTNSPLTVAASDASAGYGLYKMGADCNATPILIGVIPNGTVIPARGHYLFVGSAYSLTNYGGAGAAAGNLTLSSDIETDGNVGLFTTSDVTGISSVNRLDAVGFGANVGGACNLLREATTLPPIAANATIEHSYFRKMCDWIQGQGCTVPGIPKDTNINADDFWLADTAASSITGRLGAPGPENLASPIRRDNANNPGSGGIDVFLLDSTVGSATNPNRARNSGDPAGTFGSMTLRYRVTNNTGGQVTRLRYRVVDISTAIQPAGPVADLRALTSSVEIGLGPVNDAVTCTAAGAGAPPCTVTVTATTLETPPNQAIGGGYNSTLSSGTITTGSPLPNDQSILINFKLGVQKTGTFRFYIIVEALP